MSTTPTNRWSLFELSATYYQDSDCNDIAELGQELKISAESNGSGAFLVLSTKRWAVSGPTELQALIADFIGRGAGLPLEQVAIDLQDPDPVRGNIQMRENELLYGHHHAHEYGFGKPAGPYPVEAIDMNKVRVATPEPIKLEFPDTCPYCAAEGELFTTCTTPACKGVAEAWYGGTKPRPEPVVAPEPIVAPEPAVVTVAEPKPRGLSRNGEPLRAWTAAHDEQLQRDYATTPNKVLAAALGRSEKAVLIRACKFNLRKAAPTASPQLAITKPRAEQKPVVLAKSSAAPMAPKAVAAAAEPTINAGLETKLMKLVGKLGLKKLQSMDEHDAQQALALLTQHRDKLAWVPGAARLLERLSGHFSLPMGATMEGSAAHG